MRWTRRGRRGQPPRHLWALDLETTGLDPDRARMIAVGMVPVVDGVIRLGHAYSSLVHPSLASRDRLLVPAGPAERTAATSTADGTHLAVRGIEAHHLRPRDVADAPPLTAVLPAVLARLADGDGLLVHHAPLDLSVLRRACAQTGSHLPDLVVVDTMVEILQRNRRRRAIGLPALPTDLAGARSALGLPPHDAHDALHDAVATAELHLALQAAA